MASPQAARQQRQRRVASARRRTQAPAVNAGDNCCALPCRRRQRRPPQPARKTTSKGTPGAASRHCRRRQAPQPGQQAAVPEPLPEATCRQRSRQAPDSPPVPLQVPAANAGSKRRRPVKHQPLGAGTDTTRNRSAAADCRPSPQPTTRDTAPVNDGSRPPLLHAANATSESNRGGPPPTPAAGVARPPNGKCLPPTPAAARRRQRLANSGTAPGSSSAAPRPRRPHRPSAPTLCARGACLAASGRHVHKLPPPLRRAGAACRQRQQRAPPAQGCHCHPRSPQGDADRGTPPVWQRPRPSPPVNAALSPCRRRSAPRDRAATATAQRRRRASATRGGARHRTGSQTTAASRMDRRGPPKKQADTHPHQADTSPAPPVTKTDGQRRPNGPAPPPTTVKTGGQARGRHTKRGGGRHPRRPRVATAPPSCRRHPALPPLGGRRRRNNEQRRPPPPLPGRAMDPPRGCRPRESNGHCSPTGQQLPPPARAVPPSPSGNTRCSRRRQTRAGTGGRCWQRRMGVAVVARVARRSEAGRRTQWTTQRAVTEN